MSSPTVPHAADSSISSVRHEEPVILAAAVIGLGPMGLTHAAIANSLGSSKVVGVADSDERLLRIGRKLVNGIQFFSDYMEMVTQLQPDCVYVCTPPYTHYEIVRKLLDHSTRPRGIFVEKPLAASRSEAQELASSLGTRGMIGAVGYQKRFIGAFQRTKELLQKGALGRVVLFRAHQFTPGILQPIEGWRSEPATGGATIEWGIHLIDLLVWLFGAPSGIEASRSRVVSSRVEDYARAGLTYANGVAGLVEIGWSMRNFSPPELMIEIHGTEGALNVTEDRIVVYGGREQTGEDATRPILTHTASLTPPVPFLLGQPENVIEELHFQECVRHGTAPVNSFQESVRVHQIVDAIRAAPLR